MKRGNFAWLAVCAVGVACVIELGTLDLGHELTWFGSLSQQQSAGLRISALTIAALLVVAVFLKRKRNSPR